MSEDIVWIGCSGEVLVGDLHDNVEENKLVDKEDDILEEVLFDVRGVCRILKFSNGWVGILFEIENIVMSFVNGKGCWPILVIEFERLGDGELESNR